MNNRFFILTFVIAVFVLGGLLYIYNPEPVEYKVQKEDQVLCPQDAKLCPDGSYVFRGGPNCTFDPCPIPENAKMEDGTLLNQKEDIIVCPMDAKQCPDGSFVGREGPSCEFKKCPQ